MLRQHAVAPTFFIDVTPHNPFFPASTNLEKLSTFDRAKLVANCATRACATVGMLSNTKRKV